MSQTGQALTLNDHRLVPAVVEDHSVVTWVCLDCDAEYGCASEYLGDVCIQQFSNP